MNELTEEELRDLQVDLRNSDNQNKWWEYEPLKSLDLSSNSLTKLSEAVKYMGDLVNLDVCNCIHYYKSITNKICKIKSIQFIKHFAGFIKQILSTDTR